MLMVESKELEPELECDTYMYVYACMLCTVATCPHLARGCMHGSVPETSARGMATSIPSIWQQDKPLQKVQTCMCMCLCMCLCVWESVWACVCVFVFVFVCLCVSICMYTHIYSREMYWALSIVLERWDSRNLPRGRCFLRSTCFDLISRTTAHFLQSARQKKFVTPIHLSHTHLQ